MISPTRPTLDWVVQRRAEEGEVVENLELRIEDDRARLIPTTWNDAAQTLNLTGVASWE